MSINFKAVKVSVNAVLDSLLGDTSLARDITYKKYTSESFDSTKGYTVSVFTSTIIKAIKLKHNEFSQKLDIGEVQAGDTVYLIRNIDMPSGASLKDILIDGSETLKVKSLQDIFQLAWGITAESK